MVLPSRHSYYGSSDSFDECGLSAKWLPTTRPSQLTWAITSAVRKLILFFAVPRRMRGSV